MPGTDGAQLSPAKRNASALAWRTAERRFHILVFQWRRLRFRCFASFVFATSASWCFSGFQARPGSQKLVPERV